MRIAPECDVPEPGQQVHQRGLAAAVGADEGDRLAMPDRQVDAPEHRTRGRRSRTRPRRTRSSGGAGQPDGAPGFSATWGSRSISEQIRSDAAAARWILECTFDNLRIGSDTPARHRIKRQQVFDHHRLDGKLELERAEVQEDRAACSTRYEPASRAIATVIRASISSTGSDMASIIATRTLLR